MRRQKQMILRWILLGSAAFALGIALGPTVHHIQAQISSEIKPYGVWFHQTVTDGQGKAVFSGDSFEGRRSNGDSVRATLGDPTTKLITFASKGIVVETNSRNNNITTNGNGRPIRTPAFGTRCENYDGITGKSKAIEGVETLQSLIHHGTTDQELWLAPSLGCVPLEVSTYFRNDAGNSKGIDARVATRLVIGEPLDEFFKLPEHPLETRPLEYAQSLGMHPRLDREAKYDAEKAERGK